jgi:ribonuclease-3
VTADREKALLALEQRLGYRFRDRGLLDRALTHTSYANESLVGGAPHNEPLEFLGDAVLSLAIAEMLHSRHPHVREGAKTRARARLVGDAALARRAVRLGLPALLRLGRGEEKTGGRNKDRLASDAYEAVIAAIHLDGGFDAAAGVVRAQFEDEFAGTELFVSGDHKSALQERLQGEGRAVPDYVVVAEETGPQTRFRVECRIDGVARGDGTASTKRRAQQEAARQALEWMRQGAGR